MKMGGILLVLLCFGADGVMFRAHKSISSIQQNTTDDASPYVLDRCTEVKEVFGQAKYMGKDQMSLKTCYTFCSSRGAFYFGVRNGKDCWCGSQYQARIGGSTYCNVPCPGDKKEMCGGADATSVYIMGGGPCGEGEGEATGESDDKNLKEADQALDKVMKEAEKVVAKKNKKYEIKGAKRMDEAKRVLARAKEDVAAGKQSAAKKKLKVADAKVKEATKQFDKMKSLGDEPTMREQQAEQDLKMVKKALKDVAANPSTEAVKKADKLLNQAAAKPPPKRAPVCLNMASNLKSFGFMGLSDQFLRIEKYKLKASKISDKDRIDATFEMMPALLASADCGVSFRSKKFPKRYLRHRGFRLYLDTEQDKDLFKKDATFFAVAAKDASTGAYLFRSANFPDRYIHLRGNGEAYLDPLTLGTEKEFSFKIGAPLFSGMCEMWDFVALPTNDLMAIKMGPTTGTKMTEVHTLGKSSNYKNWVLQVGTGLGLTAKTSPKEEWDFAALPNGDLMSIKMGPTTGSKKTEVHILSKSSNYKSFALHAATGLQLTNHKSWDFVVRPDGDLMGVLKGPKTGSGKTEVHILSKSSNYARFNLHAATGLELTTGATEWDFQAMPNGDLMCIKMGPKTGSGKTEVHVLSKSSNYAKFNLHTATGLQLTTHKQWSFATLPNGDLMCILKGPTSGTKKTEVHTLSKSSNYKNFVLQTGTGLALTVPPPGSCSVV